MIKSWRGKGKTLLKKGFSPFPAPLSSFLKLLLFQADLSLSRAHGETFFTMLLFLCLSGAHVTAKRKTSRRFNNRHRSLPSAGGPDVVRDPRAWKSSLPACFCSPALGDPSKISGNLFLTHDCPTFVGQESATAGGRDSAHLHCVRRPNSAPQPRNRCRFPSPASLRLRALLPRSRPAERQHRRRNQGGPGGELFPPAGAGAEPRCSG